MSLRTELRREMRARRLALGPRQRQEHAQALAGRLTRSIAFLRSRRIAAYLSQDGELDLGPTVERAWSMGKRCYLPVLKPNPFKGLWFAPHKPGSRMFPNRFGIPEPCPRGRQRTQPWALDLVLVPLVAFDTSGNRLGMGGGYYDRTFGYLRRNGWKSPTLVGIAYDFQRVAELPLQPWDVALDAILTDAGWYPNHLEPEARSILRVGII